MSVILILILASLAVAVAFLACFVWAVKAGQFEDTCTPGMRILGEDEAPQPATGRNVPPLPAGVAQVSKPAVSPTSSRQVVGRGAACGLETRDTAGLETRATRTGGALDRFVSPKRPPSGGSGRLGEASLPL
jgi:cbb3-type cytochrome oxidase maturation protein